MMANEDSKFVENHKEYIAAFRVFARNRSDQHQVWVESNLVPKLRDVLTQGTSASKSEFKVLAAGSNVGLFDCLLIKVLFSHANDLLQGKEITYTVFEPNAAAIDEFKYNVASQGDIFQRVKFNWINQRIEEFFEAKEPENYDLIHFMHVLYYVENEEEILKHAYEKLLASPGCILAVVVSERSIWVDLVEPFKLKIPSLIQKQPTNIELSDICKRNGWAHEVFDAELDLEVTEVFYEGDPVGQAILKFFLHINEDPKEKLGKELISEVMEFFGRMSWEKMENGKKLRLVKEDEGILLTYKRS